MKHASVHNVDLLDVESGLSEQHHPIRNPPAQQAKADESAPTEDVMTDQERQNKKYTRNRCIYLAFMATTSVFGSWLITTLTFAIFPRPIGPSRETATKALENIYTEPTRQGEIWEQCIRKEGERCRNETALAHDREAARISAIQASNQAKLEQASMPQTQCALRYSDTETALRDWVLAGNILPWNDTCPSDDRDTILEAAGGDVRKGQEELINIFARMSDESRQQLLVVTTFLEDYAIYNRDYFFGRLTLLEADLLAQIGDLAAISLDGISLVKVTGLDGFNGIIACVSPVNGSPAVCSIPSLSASLNFTLEEFKGYLEITSEAVQQAIMVIATLVERYDWAVAGLEDFVRIFQGIRSVLGRPFDLALDSLGGIDLGQFVDIAPGRYFVPDGLNIPDFGELPNFQPALDDLRDEIRRLKEGVRNVADQVSDELKDKVDQLVTEVREAFAGVFEDYDPPKYPGFNSSDFEGIIGDYDNRYEKFRAQFERAVQELKLIRDKASDGDTYEFVAEDVIDFGQVESYKEVSPDLLGIKLPTIPEFIQKIYRWFDNFYWLLDTLIRIWYITSRCLQYYHESAVPVPKIIVGTPGTDRQQEQQQQQEEKKPRWKKVLDIFFSPKWILVALVVSAILSLTAFGFILNEYIMHYQGRCVESETGTSIVRRLILPTVHDPAKFDGNIARTQENLKLYVQRTRACTSLGSSSHVIHRQQEESLFSISYDYNATLSESSRILDCIDLNALGGDGARLQEDLLTCSVPIEITLENGEANCNWQKCEINCSESKVTEAITKVVIKNSCVYEWYLLSELIIFFLKWLQYWCVGIALILLQMAIFVLFRKFLRRDSVKWVYEEDMEDRSIVGAGGLKLEDAKVKARKAHVTRETIIAVAQVFLAIVVTAIWIYFRIHVARSDDFLKPKWFVEL